MYDQFARPHIKDIIQKTIEATGIPLNETEQLLQAIEKEYLQKNKNENKYNIGGQLYEKITIAEFVLYKAKRVNVDTSFDEKKIKKIPYADKARIPKLLLAHLKEYESANEAFSPEGLEKLAKKNNNKHIRTVTILDGPLKDEHKDNLFGNKYLENDSIAYFVIYENKQTKERPEMFSLSVYIAANRIRQGLPVAEKKRGTEPSCCNHMIWSMSQLDEEWEKIKKNEQNPIDWSNRKVITKGFTEW
ncbi:MAG: hypothetical protein IMW88_03570 [Thermoflavifilum sp.]|uniref:hypothetical protein n=1 Tax=Thermoflavifilum sp. TaxID=1968839 RepID=UPI0018A3BD00|nr:hypothetical protein [Thermoflavifilum sp.]QOR76634.1 MAG: hypothetical protein IMW88_03570 [Thermoflavifilum sp.]